jgi:hypothetical protein
VLRQAGVELRRPTTAVIARSSGRDRQSRQCRKYKEPASNAPGAGHPFPPIT